MFKESYWRPSFGCPVKESFDNQIDYIEKRLDKTEEDEKVFMYINIDAIHYPNYFYIEGNKKKGGHIESHAAALRYVDERLERLFKNL